MIFLRDAEPHIRAELTKLAESPRALRAFVVINCPTTGRFVQFCTPPPPSKFAHSPRVVTDEPLIYDGTGDGKPGGYDNVGIACGVDRAVRFALEVLGLFLPAEAELEVRYDVTLVDRPS